MFRERLADGLIVLEDVSQGEADRATALVGSAVWVNANILCETGCIRRDEHAAGRTVARELYRLGYRKMVYADKDDATGHYSRDARWKGVKSFAGEVGVDARRVESGLIQSASELPESLARVGRDTAVIACDAYRARLLQFAYGDLGLRPGHDFALACCDDTAKFSWTWPGLARVRFDRSGMGVKAAEMILKKVADPTVRIASEMIGAEWLPGSMALRVRE